MSEGSICRRRPKWLSLHFLHFLGLFLSCTPLVTDLCCCCNLGTKTNEFFSVSTLMIQEDNKSKNRKRTMICQSLFVMTALDQVNKEKWKVKLNWIWRVNIKLGIVIQLHYRHFLRYTIHILGCNMQFWQFCGFGKLQYITCLDNLYLSRSMPYLHKTLKLHHRWHLNVQKTPWITLNILSLSNCGLDFDYKGRFFRGRLFQSIQIICKMKIQLFVFVTLLAFCKLHFPNCINLSLSGFTDFKLKLWTFFSKLAKYVKKYFFTDFHPYLLYNNNIFMYFSYF